MFAIVTEPVIELRDLMSVETGTRLRVYTDEVPVVPGVNAVVLQYRKAGLTSWQTDTPTLIADGPRWLIETMLPWAASDEVELRVMVTPPQGQSTFSRSISVKLA